MKRPFGYACLFFILFIRLFYVCFPPKIPAYPTLEGREVYVSGQIISKQYQIVSEEPCLVYTLGEVRLLESSEAKQSVLTDDKAYFGQNTKELYKHNKIICYAAECQTEPSIGANVWIKGRFQGYEAPENPGQFDRRLYYHMQHLGGRLKEAEIIWQDGRKDVLRQGIYEWKQQLIKKADRYFAPKYSGVMKTMLLGDKADLEPGLKQLFQEGGILHILSISGMHISMIGMSSYRFLRKLGLPVKGAAVAGGVLVLLYGMLVGSQAATVRSIIMFLMQMAAILLGRTYDRLTGLAVAAVLLLLEQPMYVFSSGFLLSFGTVLGITVLTPIVEKICKDRGKIAEFLGKTLGGSIGALLASFPMQLYFFYEYPLYSMVVNVLILPFLPYIMWFGAAVLLVPGIAAGFMIPFAYGVEIMLWCYEWICTKISFLPFHSIVLGAPQWWQIVGYYGCLVIAVKCYGALGSMKLHSKYGEKVLRRVHRAKKNIRSTFISSLEIRGFYRKYRSIIVNVKLFILLALAFIFVLWRPSPGLELAFLSVGQGDCTVVQYEDRAFVIDCGSTRKSNVGSQVLVPYLKSQGISKVEGVFLSHADTDHISGIVGWLTEYEHSHVKVERLILPGLAEEVLNEEFQEILALAQYWQIPVATVGAGDVLDLGEFIISVMHPEKGTTDTKDRNGYSQVLLLEYAGHSVLFTGDIGEDEERQVAGQLVTGQLAADQLTDPLSDQRITLLKAAHHGSRFSSSEDFLKLCQPEHVVFSYGVGNSYGHPHQETVERMEEAGARLWYTGRQGAIIVQLGKEGVTVRVNSNKK